MTLHAKESRTEVRLDYRVNETSIDATYADNTAKLDSIIALIKDLRTDSTRSIVSVTFRGTASPEGRDKWNRHLAGARLASIENLIRSEVHIPDSIIKRDTGYIDWDYLRREVNASRHSYKDTVIAIIGSRPASLPDPDYGTPADSRIVRLKQLDNRKVWNELSGLYFGNMRNAIAVIVTYGETKTRPVAMPAVPKDMAGLRISTCPRLARPVYVRPCRKAKTGREGKPFQMALHTNLLYDAVAVPNIGAEFHLGKKWSIAGNWMYAWWSRDISHRYWRVYGGDVSVRRWFGNSRQALTGHHLGIYGQMLTYDFEFGGKGRQGGRWTWGAGVSYGYSLPLHRNLNLDLSVGFGYLSGQYKKYHPADGCYVWESTHRLNWIGPTKAEVSLVWLISAGHTGKGGGR